MQWEDFAVASMVQRCASRGLAHPPSFLADNMQYEVIMGSQAYGCATDDSDWDIYGFTIPRKEDVFPNLRGEIIGFGRQKNRFESWQEHHIDDPETKRQYDFQVFSIVRFFSLVMENNPNVLDALFVPEQCVIHCTNIGRMVRDKRRMFLHKGSFHKLRGYAFSQIKKMGSQERVGKRKEEVEKYGFDLKFASHVIRLASECEQILTEGDLTLDREDRREMMKSVRRGEWTKERVEEFFAQKEKHLDDLYHSSTLRHGPDEDAIKNLLLQCLEHHYGSLEKAIVREDAALSVFRQMAELVEKNKNLLG
jgi:predicted nucleotidyltransferase